MDDLVKRLVVVLPECWGRDTSVEPSEWKPERPLRGNCGVTAMVVQDLTGWRIARGTCWVGDFDFPHFWNHDGQKVRDVTAPFLPQSLFHSETEQRDGALRQWLDARPDTVKRYELLRDRVMKALGAPQLIPGVQG